MHGQLVSTEKDELVILSECIDKRLPHRQYRYKLIQVSCMLLMYSRKKNKKLGSEYEVQCSIILLLQRIDPSNKFKFNPQHQLKF